MLTAKLSPVVRPRLTRTVAAAAAMTTRRRAFASPAVSSADLDAPEPYFPDEPRRPHMVTSVPGPETKKMLDRLDKYQDTRSVFFVAGTVGDICLVSKHQIHFFLRF